MSNDNPFDDAEIIYSYSRKQAIEDGVLVDLSPWASETGFVIPVACTSTVWHQYVVPPEGTEDFGQSERGRCHDLLWMLLVAIKKHGDCDHVMFEVIFLNSKRQHETIKLKAVCGPGDEGEPVITVMLPEED